MGNYSIKWLNAAQVEYDGFLDSIAADSPLVAIWIDKRMNQQIGQLALFPQLGRIGRVPYTFELVISRTPYVAIYQVAGNTIQILHIIHSSQSWPPETEETDFSPL